ncbi:MAG: serine protease [Opitutaceae bacterium]|nr:serine protease [Opitutaceae bacterium]
MRADRIISWARGAGVPLALALLGGCVSSPSSAERAASFQPFASRRVGAEPLQDFLTQRTAVLIGGMPADAVSTVCTESVASALKAVHGRYAVGSATAIDARGYFLTAAHCLEWQPLHVVRADGARIRLSMARVVWRGDPSAEGGDLAVLAIDESLRGHFSWADPVEAGEPVVGVGPNYDAAADFGLGCFSGRTLKLEKHAEVEPRGTTVFHSGPMHLGDSGGPLATTGGQLIAVNVGDIHELNLLRLSHEKASRAHRPNLEWLRQLVERDVSSARGTALSGL